MAFTLRRMIRFQETDAAGVVYFANLLALCHEAYEASLANAGIALKPFFSTAENIAVPIVHTSADFYQPMYCGDEIAVTLTPQQLSPHSFEITYVVTAADSPERVLAKALTRHVCISPTARARQPLTLELSRWLKGEQADGG
jgi:1,4-dihydroxy-2-naphthoyl-CoA hydrolase